MKQTKGSTQSCKLVSENKIRNKSADLAGNEEPLGQKANTVLKMRKQQMDSLQLG